MTQDRNIRRQKIQWCCLGLATALAAILYLSITFHAALTGDDCYNNPASYYLVTHQSFWQTCMEELRGILDALALKSNRFFPFMFPPAWIRYSLKGSIVVYRLYIIVYTLADAALLGWIVSKLTRSRELGMAFFAALPLMICLWSEAGSNGMYCYEALPQATLFAALLACACMLRWAKTRRIRWAVLQALLIFFCCGIYELGYVYIVMLGFAALMLHESFWESVKTGLPALPGELAALGFHAASSWRNASAGTYEGVQFAFDPGKLLLTWVQQMSAAFPLNQLLFGGAEIGEITLGDILWPLLLAAVFCTALLANRVVLTKKQCACLCGMAAALIALPAFLIGLSAKYQNIGWVTWHSAYIPAVVESFGVGLLLVVAAAAVFRRLRGRARTAAAVVLLAALTACGACQRAATRTRYPASGRYQYELLAGAVEQGIANEAGEQAPVLCDFPAWGGYTSAQQMYFRRYTGREVNAYFLDTWLAEGHQAEGPLYRMGNYANYGGYAVIWFGRVQDDAGAMELLRDVRVYVDGKTIPRTGVLKYYCRQADGTDALREVPLAELKHSPLDERGGYFVTIEEENVVAPKIMIWAG